MASAWINECGSEGEPIRIAFCTKCSMKYKQIAQPDEGPVLRGCPRRGPKNSQNAPRDVICINLHATIFL